MKKFAAMLLALLLCLGMACAEEAAFTFRNGVRWGMSPEEIQSAEGCVFDGYNDTDIGMTMGVLSEAPIGQFQGAVGYIFLDERLIAVSAVPELWVDTDRDAIDALLREFTALYGAVDETLPQPQPIQNLLAVNGYQIMAAWQPDADTYIAVMVSPSQYIELGYFDVNYDLIQIMREAAEASGNGL